MIRWFNPNISAGLKSSRGEGTPAATIQEPDLGRVFDVAAYGICSRNVWRRGSNTYFSPNTRWLHIRHQWSYVGANTSSWIHHRSSLGANHRPLGHLQQSTFDRICAQRIGDVCVRNWSQQTVEVSFDLITFRHIVQPHIWNICICHKCTILAKLPTYIIVTQQRSTKHITNNHQILPKSKLHTLNYI